MFRTASLLALVPVILTGAARAHHSQVSLFDSSRTIEITGASSGRSSSSCRTDGWAAPAAEGAC
ncbi:MAG TPA: hypothetical protein VF329_11100 [Gammaproteobacteria bacterium]